MDVCGLVFSLRLVFFFSFFFFSFRVSCRVGLRTTVDSNYDLLFFLYYSANGCHDSVLCTLCLPLAKHYVK